MPRITDLYAYVIADKDDDDEGVPAFPSMSGMMMPMMGADQERAASLRRMAQEMATASGKPIKLIRSTGIELVETIEP